MPMCCDKVHGTTTKPSTDDSSIRQPNPAGDTDAGGRLHDRPDSGRHPRLLFRVCGARLDFGVVS